MVRSKQPSISKSIGSRTSRSQATLKKRDDSDDEGLEMYMDSKIEEDDDEDEEAVFDLDGEVCIILL